MKTKVRLSASVDKKLFEAAQASVAAGTAESVSSWVNEALQRQMNHDSRMAALGEFIAAHEAKFGVIDDKEMRQAARHMRSRAISVRGPKKSDGTRARGGKRA
ncbi:MAG: hypothetical protein ACRDIU_00965 [Actinomycetota bacterium]